MVYDRDTWHDLWADWVPTTTGVLQPEHTVALDGAEETADFGWRPVERSDDVGAPISETVTGEGLTVQSYVDVVTAQQIADHLTTEFLVTAEAPDTTVRFGYKGLSSNSTTVLRSDGEVTGVSSTSYSAYTRWISPSGDHTMAHEYGHAWANYHMYTHWDDEWESLYRQLFASANAADVPHMNSDIPEFTTGPDDTTDDTTDDDPTDDAEYVDETGMTGNPELVYDVCDPDGVCSNTVEFNT